MLALTSLVKFFNFGFVGLNLLVLGGDFLVEEGLGLLSLVSFSLPVGFFLVELLFQVSFSLD